MRIKDLFENTEFKFKDFVENNEINYDLAEDLVFFMNHNDDTYRRHTYPAITKCLEGIKKKKRPHQVSLKMQHLKVIKATVKNFPSVNCRRR